MIIIQYILSFSRSAIVHENLVVLHICYILIYFFYEGEKSNIINKIYSKRVHLVALFIQFIGVVKLAFGSFMNCWREKCNKKWQKNGLIVFYLPKYLVVHLVVGMSIFSFRIRFCQWPLNTIHSCPSSHSFAS